MSEQGVQDRQEKRMTDGGWVLLFFGILFLVIIVLGWLTL
jgi:hypothetical protein